MKPTVICGTPEDTFDFGKIFADRLRTGDAVLLFGGLGAGKTLFTKGLVGSLGFDVDEVTSPSFTLVNIYHADRATVFHIDLWRLEDGSNAAFGVGLDEIVENDDAIVVIEWAEKLGGYHFPGRVFEIRLEGEGDDPRTIEVIEREPASK